MKWWLSSGDKPEGPFPAEHVAEWLKSGQIAPDTMACPDGDRQWTRLCDVDEFAQLAPAPPPPSREPPPPPPPSPAAAGPTVATVPAGAYRPKFGILTATIVLSACGLLVDLLLVGDTGEAVGGFLLQLGVYAAAVIVWAIFHYHLWMLLPARFAETTPGKAVGFMFIPFFNCYWVFRSYLGVNRGLNQIADAHGLPPPRANVGLATAAAVIFVVGWCFALVALSLPSFDDVQSQYVIRDAYDLSNAYDDVAAQHVGFNLLVLLLCSIPSFVLWLRMVEHLLKNGAPLNAASGVDRILSRRKQKNAASGQYPVRHPPVLGGFGKSRLRAAFS